MLIRSARVLGQWFKLSLSTILDDCNSVNNITLMGQAFLFIRWWFLFDFVVTWVNKISYEVYEGLSIMLSSTNSNEVELLFN